MSFSEDFAHFCAAVPGCFLLLGNGEDGPSGQPLHAADYDFNDALLPIGTNFWVELVHDRLSAKNRKNIMERFLNTPLQHTANNRKQGDAAYRVLSKRDFSNAVEEITAWEGYAPTPLVVLNSLAAELGIDQIVYKHEGPRFGLGSFKALGGSYAALRVLQRELSRRLAQDVNLADIRTGKYREACAGITLVSATDGNHGRSLAWGCSTLWWALPNIYPRRSQRTGAHRRCAILGRTWCA